MNKLFLVVLFFSFSLNSFADEVKNRVANELGLSKSFLETPVFNSIYNKYSSDSKISYYNNIFRKSTLNMEIVRQEIQKKRLPDAMFFIPLFESSYVNQGKGKGPGGLWQIIPETADNLKLKIDDSIDERLDLVKSTDAAGTNLKKYYKTFDKWYLAIAAYNSGEGRVVSGIARASLDKYLDENPEEENSSTVKLYKGYIDEYNRTKKGISNLYEVYYKYKKHFDFSYLVENNHKDYLSDGTIEYISKIVTFAIMKEKDSFSAIDKKAKYDLEVINPPKGIQMKSLANLLDMNQNELYGLNRHIKNDVLPTSIKYYNVYIPHTKLDVYNQKIGNIKTVVEKNNKNTKVETKKASKDSNKKDITKKENRVIYVAKSGDTLESIAKKYKTTSKKLNVISRKDKKVLSKGDKIEIIK